MKKTVISIALTLLLGPGAGHLYLRRFLKGCGFIIVSLAMAAVFLWQVIKTVPNLELLNQNPGQAFQDFAAAHSTVVFYYDVIFAALWAYAIVDAFFKAQAMDRAAAAQDEAGNPEE